MADNETVQASWITYLKSKTALTALLTNGGANEIRESQWQGDDFAYPAVRISMDYMPSVIDCFDSVDAIIDVFSEQKSSKEAAHIAATLLGLLHNQQINDGTTNSWHIHVERIDRPIRDMYAWKASLKVNALVV